MSRLVPYAGSSARRRAGSVDAANAANQPSPQDRLEAVAKFIPGEILAFFLPATNAAQLLPVTERVTVHLALFLGAWVLVPLYFWWVAAGDPRSVRQIVISTLAFPVWAYATNRDVGALGSWFSEPRALLFLLIFTLATSFLVPKRQQ